MECNMIETRLTIIESPFATDRQLIYLKRCLRDSWNRGELPFASHAFFTLFLDEDNSLERKQGIHAGYKFYAFAGRAAFYYDFGMSPGMDLATDFLKENYPDLPRTIRLIGQKEGDHDFI